MSIYDKNMQKGQFESNTQKESKLEEMFNPQLCLLILYSRHSTGTGRRLSVAQLCITFGTQILHYIFSYLQSPFAIFGHLKFTSPSARLPLGFELLIF